MRLQLLFRGRMPHTSALAHDWYDTPNIHLCTITDFVDLADKMGITIERALTLDRTGTRVREQRSGAFANCSASKRCFCSVAAPRLKVAASSWLYDGPRSTVSSGATRMTRHAPAPTSPLLEAALLRAATESRARNGETLVLAKPDGSYRVVATEATPEAGETLVAVVDEEGETLMYTLRMVA